MNIDGVNIINMYQIYQYINKQVLCEIIRLRSNCGNPSHSPIGKYFPNSKYENVKNKQIQLFIFAPAGAKILDLFDSEHPYLESRKSLLREFTPKGDFILMATGVPAFL